MPNASNSMNSARDIVPMKGYQLEQCIDKLPFRSHSYLISITLEASIIQVDTSGLHSIDIRKYKLKRLRI